MRYSSINLNTMPFLPAVLLFLPIVFLVISIKVNKRVCWISLFCIEAGCAAFLKSKSDLLIGSGTIQLLVIQIALLAKSIKKRTGRFWIATFVIEYISLMTVCVLCNYYDRLASVSSGGLFSKSYLGEQLLYRGFIFVYVVVICVTIIAAITVYAQNPGPKPKGRACAKLLMFIIAMVLIMTGVGFLAKQISENWGGSGDHRRGR